MEKNASWAEVTLIGVKELEQTHESCLVFNMPRPQSKEEGQRFNSIVTYLEKFIPNLSEKMAPWEWNQEHEKS